jgi:hypothetical protein
MPELIFLDLGLGKSDAMDVPNGSRQGPSCESRPVLTHTCEPFPRTKASMWQLAVAACGCSALCPQPYTEN